jgi:hypothetical protein
MRRVHSQKENRRLLAKCAARTIKTIKTPSAM